MSRTLHTSLSRHWKALFGGPVRRVGLDAGLNCPNRATGGCSYCDPASFAPMSNDPRSVEVQLSAGIEALKKKGVTRAAAYFQAGTNTNAPLDRLKELWDSAASPPEVVALCVGTRPDCVGDPVLDLLSTYNKRFGEIWLELGLQTAHDPTLTALGRGHTVADFTDACARAKERGIKVCAHVILGLPGETPCHEGETARYLSKVGVQGIKLHQLAIVRATPLENAYHRGEIGVLTEAQYVERVVAFLKALTVPAVLHRLVGDSIGESEIAPRLNKGRVQALIDAQYPSP